LEHFLQDDSAVTLLDNQTERLSHLNTHSDYLDNQRRNNLHSKAEIVDASQLLGLVDGMRKVRVLVANVHYPRYVAATAFVDEMESANSNCSHVRAAMA
jgi:hypothetical protein